MEIRMPSPFGDTTTGMMPRVTLTPPSDRLIVELERRKVGLVAYCQIKLDAGDWHAVQDAASDIRELDAKLELLKNGK
jgi:hypothetical protein